MTFDIKEPIGKSYRGLFIRCGALMCRDGHLAVMFWGVVRALLKPIFAFTIGAVVGSAACSTQAGLSHPESAQATAPVALAQNQAFEYIQLSRRNWESRGTDTRITGDGHYVVQIAHVNQLTPIREGQLQPPQLEQLTAAISRAQLLTLPDEYTAPFQTEWSWWGYELTVKFEEQTKTVRFHSEDAAVPRSLTELVEQIVELAR